MDLKDINDPGHWHIAIAVAGLAIAIAAITAANKPIVLAGFGMISFGVGQMRNHPYQEKLVYDDFGVLVAKVTGHPRNPSPLGLILEATGGILFLAGLGWFILG